VRGGQTDSIGMRETMEEVKAQARETVCSAATWPGGWPGFPGRYRQDASHPDNK